MTAFEFLIPELRKTTPQEWLLFWAGRYGQDRLPNEYEELIQISQTGSLSSNDYERIGKWKDNAYSRSKWGPNVASVAYQIWIKAAVETPKCPKDSRGDLAGFLIDWSERAYTDTYKSGPVRKHFGLSRATTLLHFVSGGRLPIFDSRVRAAITRLLDDPKPEDSVAFYLDSYCPLFSNLAALCECQDDDSRILDKALFSYGAAEESEFLRYRAMLAYTKQSSQFGKGTKNS